MYTLIELWINKAEPFLTLLHFHLAKANVTESIKEATIFDKIFLLKRLHLLFQTK
jgi:hypothetical protein